MQSIEQVNDIKVTMETQETETTPSRMEQEGSQQFAQEKKAKLNQARVSSELSRSFEDYSNIDLCANFQQDNIASIARMIDELQISDEDQIKLDLAAKPFNPQQAFPAVAVEEAQETLEQQIIIQPPTSNVSDANQNPEVLGGATQGHIDMHIRAMKAQHQYIQNLQRCNLSLKSKIKSLED